MDVASQLAAKITDWEVAHHGSSTVEREWSGQDGAWTLRDYSPVVFDEVHEFVGKGSKAQFLVVCETLKRDIGLFAMEHSTAFVAAVEVGLVDELPVLDDRFYDVLADARAFSGPSVVIALLQARPFLYRFNPAAEQPFQPESGQMSSLVEDFLAREEQLVLFLAKADAKGADALEAGLAAAGEAVTVLYGSDTGHAQECASRISRLIKKSQKVTTRTMNDAEPLSGVVLFVTSTAGKGDFPANAHDFWAALEKRTDQLPDVRFSTLALGDSKYWPDPAHFAAAGRRLHEKLLHLGAQPLFDLEIADEQETDGYRAGYQRWEQQVCKVLGVSAAGADAAAGDAPHMSPEEAKFKSNYLRGTLAQTLADRTTGAIPQPDQVVIKHHGIYLQDDRDLRAERAQLGIEEAYMFMIRVRLTAGDSTAKQWAAMDELADKLCYPNLKITTRQTFQVQGIQKHNLIESVRSIQRAAMDTIAACGDVARNVTCTSHPAVPAKLMAQVVECSKEIHDHVLPRSSAWHEIFIMDKGAAGNKKYKVGGSTPHEEEPLYGKIYLPRKWKMGVAIPPYNDVDVYSNDVGFIAIEEGGELKGFNVVAGGGLGFTHNQRATFPRLGSMCGYVDKDQAKFVAEMMIAVQRDYGCRSDRKHARLKYTIHDRGIEWFKEQVEDLLGFKFEPPRPFEFAVRGDLLGWGEQDGKLHCGLYIGSGRVQGEEKRGLRKIADLDVCRFRMTCNQSLCLTHIDPKDKEVITSLLTQHGIRHGGVSGLRAESNACAALPLCGLAMAEAERYLPELVTLLEAELGKHGLFEAPISIRMTGCPNSCGRPELAEIGLVGRAPGAYNLYLGGDHLGQRANRIYKEGADESEVVAALSPLFAAYAAGRQVGERFGDYCVRAGHVKANAYGPDFHDF